MNPHASTHLYHEDLYQFNRPVVVVLSGPWAGYSPDEQKLLEKILTSVKIDIHAVQVVVTASADLAALAIYSPSKVLIFGAQTSEDIPLYTETAAQGFTVVRADDLNELDDQKKKNLWVALRQMFGAKIP